MITDTRVIHADDYAQFCEDYAALLESIDLTARAAAAIRERAALVAGMSADAIRESYADQINRYMAHATAWGEPVGRSWAGAVPQPLCTAHRQSAGGSPGDIVLSSTPFAVWRVVAEGEPCAICDDWELYDQEES